MSILLVVWCLPSVLPLEPVLCKPHHWLVDHPSVAAQCRTPNSAHCEGLVPVCHRSLPTAVRGKQKTKHQCNTRCKA